MEVNIYDAKTNLSKIIQLLVDQKEDYVIISKNGKPLVKMVLLQDKNSKRVGIAKKELKDFDMSLEEFNSLDVEGFDEYL